MFLSITCRRAELTIHSFLFTMSCLSVPLELTSVGKHHRAVDAGVLELVVLRALPGTAGARNFANVSDHPDIKLCHYILSVRVELLDSLDVDPARQGRPHTGYLRLLRHCS